MRLLNLLAPAALAASASLQPRQSPQITVSAINATGTLCSENTWVSVVSLDNNNFVVGFDENIVSTPVGLSRGDCTIEATLLYPPGCTTALITPYAKSFMSGVAGISTFMDVAVSLSTGRRASGAEEYVNRGPALDNGAAIYSLRYPIDGSIGVNDAEGREVVLTVEMGLQIQSTDETSGTFALDSVVVDIVTEIHNPDYENCM